MWPKSLWCTQVLLQSRFSSGSYSVGGVQKIPFPMLSWKSLARLTISLVGGELVLEWLWKPPLGKFVLSPHLISYECFDAEMVVALCFDRVSSSPSSTMIPSARAIPRTYASLFLVSLPCKMQLMQYENHKSLE